MWVWLGRRSAGAAQRSAACCRPTCSLSASTAAANRRGSSARGAGRERGWPAGREVGRENACSRGWRKEQRDYWQQGCRPAGAAGGAGSGGEVSPAQSSPGPWRSGGEPCPRDSPLAPVATSSGSHSVHTRPIGAICLIGPWPAAQHLGTLLLSPEEPMGACPKRVQERSPGQGVWALAGNLVEARQQVWYSRSGRPGFWSTSETCMGGQQGSAAARSLLLHLTISPFLYSLTLQVNSFRQKAQLPACLIRGRPQPFPPAPFSSKHSRSA